MVDIKQLREAYPGCADVVENIERYWITFWDTCKEHGLGPQEAVYCVKTACNLSDDNFASIRSTFHQFDHPDFLKYVQAKLGAY